MTTGRNRILRHRWARRDRNGRPFGAVALIAALFAVAPALAQKGTPGDARYVTIALATQDARTGDAPLQSGKRARIAVTLRDPATGFPISGAGMAAWIVPDTGETCAAWFGRLDRSGQIPSDVIPLVGFDVIHATRDNRIAVVDPLLDLASANIRAVRSIPAEPKAWALGPQRTLAIISGEVGAVSVFDPDGLQGRLVTLPAPARSLGADSVDQWAGLDDGRAVRIFPDGTAGPPIAVGSGPVAFAAAAGLPTVALASDGSGRILDRLERRFRFGEATGPAVLSPLANSLFALSIDGTALLVADLDDPDRQSRVALERPGRALAVSPSGRWIAIADADGTRIAIFDTEVMRVRWSVDQPDPVVEMAFSDAFLYFRHRKQGGVTRLVFDPTAPQPGLAAIAAGLPAERPQEAGPLPRLVRIEGGGVLVASETERRAYLVSESGAQAAMTMLPLRAGDTAGVLVRPRGMMPGKEPGNYAGWFSAPDNGAYLAIVRTQAPEVVQCQAFTVGPPTRRPAVVASTIDPAPQLRTTFGARELVIALGRSDATVRRVLLTSRDGRWRQFLAAAPHGSAEGTWRMPLDRVLPAGPYRLYVEYTLAKGPGGTLIEEIEWKGDPG